MSRTFELTAESAYPADRINAAFGDQSYWRARLLRFDAGRPTLDSLTTAADGTITVTVTLHFGVEQFPPPLNLLPGGALQVVQVESWHIAGDGTLHGTITVDSPGAPVSGNGRLAVTPTAGGSRMAGTGTVDVRVPLIGGTIAGFVANQLATGIREIHEFTEEWITADDRP